jgi:hypothetical protein
MISILDGVVLGGITGLTDWKNGDNPYVPRMVEFTTLASTPRTVFDGSIEPNSFISLIGTLHIANLSGYKYSSKNRRDVA